MKILIIGSRGFIGSHCVDYFSKEHEVWECDVVIDYDRPRYIFIESVDSDFQDIFINQKFDVCINCSGAANVPFSLEKPYNDFQLNTLNVFKILDAIRRFNNDCRYINMSSAAVYGNPISLPISELYDYAPVSPYGYHKQMAEMICEEFHRFWGVSTCCIRIFSAYGPRLKKQILWDIANKAIKNDIVELFGTGHETRDFIYVSDLIHLIDIVIAKATFKGDIINAANGTQIEIGEIARLTLKALGCDKRLVFKGENRKGDPLYWEADITRARELGYGQQIDIKTGINQYVKWLKENALL
ncbi:NAD-dependent epimerase/dehydratase family protein [Heminiphilus faecis]|uniref:NAD-dependent epimerase/dehydratase family protein n=1 Tax=Heminiphilus faecis TaxID=2601703 RepID=A0ABV4CTG7_9BACT